MCLGLLFPELWWFVEIGIGCAAGTAASVCSGGVGSVDAGRGTRLGSESLRSGVPDGLRRRGDPGLEEKPTLLLRLAKEKRLAEAAGVSAGEALVAEGVFSLSGDVGNVALAGEDDRFAGRALSKSSDGRLLGEGACSCGCGALDDCGVW